MKSGEQDFDFIAECFKLVFLQTLEFWRRIGFSRSHGLTITFGRLYVVMVL